MHLGESFVLLAELEQHVGDAQPRFRALLAAGNAAIPLQRLLRALEELGDLAQQQASFGVGFAGVPAQFVIEQAQGLVVLGLGQQRSAQAISLVVLRAARERGRGHGLVAERIVFGGDRQPQRGQQQGRIGKIAKHLARFFRVAGLAQLAGTQQGHPRLGREPPDRLAGDPLGQRRLVQRLGQAAESQPCLQIAGDGAGIDEFTQQPRRQLRVAAAAAQHGQGIAPAHLVLVAQQGLQFAPRSARIALAQCQRGFGGTHGQ